MALQTSLGLVPSFEDLETFDQFGLKQAEKELMCLSDFKPDFSKLVDAQGKPDLNQQTMILKVLARYPHKHLSLSHCSVLDDTALTLILANSTQLQAIDLRHCPKLTGQGIKDLAKSHPSLQILYLSDNPGITSINDDSFFF